MDKIIYVNPRLFKTLSELNVAITSKDIYKYKDPYIVFTKPFHQPVKETLDMYISSSNGKALKRLLKNSPQRMFPGRSGIRFNKGVLTINRIKISLESNETQILICEILFGWGRKKSNKRKVSLEDLNSKLVKPENDTTEKSYEHYRNPVRTLNDLIFENAGLRDVVKINKKEIYVNPVYTA